MSKKIPFQCEQAPCIVLVRPQLAENVGMVARAMMNCCLSDLRIVCPRENHLSDKAVSASSGAQEILQHAQIYEKLEDALADVHVVFATTARKRGMTKPVYHPEKAIEICSDKIHQGQKVAILFGAERTGLENEEVILSDGLIEIPLNPKHCSLNLSQAVLLVGYTWFRKNRDFDNTHLEMGVSKPATKQELQAFLDYLETELEKQGYFHWPEKRERMNRNVCNIFSRVGLTHAEIKTLYGIVSTLKKKD